MSKKKREEELRRLEMQRLQEQALLQQQSRRPTASFRTINNCAPVPVSKPADFVQLTPIVQPISLVPYSSQSQPLAMFEEDENY